MVTGTSVEMSPEATTGMNGGANFDDFERELDAVLREPHQKVPRVAAALEFERELNIYRSGSAPPTVEGSRAAIGRLFDDNPVTGTSEEEIRSHPAYLSYFYSNEHPNPRLPPPMISKEDWRAAQRFHAFGGIGDRRRWDESGSDGDDRSLFSLQPGASLQKEFDDLNQQHNLSRQRSGEWGSNGLIGLTDFGLGGRRKSLADAIQASFLLHMVFFNLTVFLAYEIVIALNENITVLHYLIINLRLENCVFWCLAMLPP